jgi:hypothetical protein
VSGRRFLALAGSGLVLFALTLAGLAAQRQHDTHFFVAAALAQGAAYALAVGLAWRCARPWRAIALILGVAAAMRVAVVAAPPYLSSDLYRYLWDGRVIAAGINPYRYIPADPSLAALRDPAIYPNINRANYAHTIYPPAAEAIFFAVTRLGQSPIAVKAAMVGFEAVAVVLLLRLLVLSGQPPTRIVIYAWHPLPFWEFAGSGHIDAAIVALVALALWSRRRWMQGWVASLALAGATLVKLYPAVILPALWRRRDWRLPAVFAAAMILAYLPFAGVGWRVFGFLPDYLAEEGFTGRGAGFYLWDIAMLASPQVHLSEVAYLVPAAALLVALAGFVALRRPHPNADIRGAALLAGAFTLLVSPHYPWYFAWLLVFACVVPSVALIWLTLASFLLYLEPVWPQLMQSRPWLVVQSALYLPFLGLAIVELRRHLREEALHDERAAG